jgi:hypothetical protein
MISSYPKTAKWRTPLDPFEADLDYPPRFWLDNGEAPPSPKRTVLPVRHSSYPDWFRKLIVVLSYLVTAELFFVIGLMARG